MNAELLARVAARGTADGRQAATVAVDEFGVDSVMDDPDDYWVGPLSGEWADDPTPTSLARDFGVDTANGDAVDEIADTYEQAWDAAWLAVLEERSK